MAAKPAAYDVASYYEKYFKYRTNHPCGASNAKNQCAVRLSLAIEAHAAGFFDDFAPQDRVHRDRSTCSNLPPHVLGAAELGRYLADQWGAPYTYNSSDEKRLARRALAGRPGVLWFVRCYETDGGDLSDHIDFWNGWHYMNELLIVGAGGNARAGADLFARSKGGVRFFPLA